MNTEQLLTEIRMIIAEVGEIDDQTTIAPETHFISELGLDSMLLLEVLAEMERRYNIRIPEEEFPNMITLNKCVETALKYKN